MELLRYVVAPLFFKQYIVMKVEFIQVLGGKDEVFSVGEIVDLPKDKANRYIEHGICILPQIKEEFVEVKQAIVKPKQVKKRKSAKK